MLFLLDKNPEDEDAYQTGIINASYFFDDIDPDQELTITGLLSEDLSTGWLPTLDSGMEKLWIEGEFDPWPTIDTITVKSLGNGDTFDGGVVEHDGAAFPKQTKFRRVVATIDCSGDFPVLAKQLLHTHLTTTIFAYQHAFESDGTNERLVTAVVPVQL
jgi:hypothetical protein